ncbi:MAG: hypothetical protein H6Q44_679, partial [Deltaproteobacteria bacterium]|nr:hypothetical protein [Deltaproteobacteria bacterium]
VLLRMVEEGIKTFVEAGPGNVLTQMVRWVSRTAKVITAEEILRERLSNAEGVRINSKSQYPMR